MSKTKTSPILCIDFEATCWERGTPKGQHSDIIEVGAALLYPPQGRIDPLDLPLVRPTRSRISGYCKNLTGISNEDVFGPEADAFDLSTVFGYLESKYHSRNLIWASWGAYDERIARENCEALGVRYPFSPTHLNAKAMYGILSGTNELWGLYRAAVEELGGFEGTQHSGRDDAFNLARILQRMIERYPALYGSKEMV